MSHFKWQDQDLLLYCHLQPKASSDAFVGLHGPRLKIRITTAPADGKANKHLLAFLAKAFSVPVRQVILEAGDSSRQKTVRIIQPLQLPAAALITKSSA
jgi:uncharacterized protein (TIGR00251 family)